MNRYLETGTEITLRGIEGTFVINALVGRGSSCAVYQAEFTNALGKTSEHLLKEFNPKSLEVIRKEDGSLCAKNEDTDAFEQSKKHFIAGFEKQELFRRKNGLKNYTANVQNYYEDHGTVYIDMNVTEGVSYTNVRERTIYDLARRMKVLAQVVGKYHEYGYLHLDLKPDNIYVRPENETCEDVLLFDFDSVIEKYKLQTNSMVSYTKEWAALELTSASRRHLICEATDIFSIGEIFFEKLMGRHSEPWERRIFSNYEYDFQTNIFKSANPKVIPLLDELFRHTLCNNVKNRYKNIDELIEILDKIIGVSSFEEPFFIKRLLDDCLNKYVEFERIIIEHKLEYAYCEDLDEYWKKMNSKIEREILDVFLEDSELLIKYKKNYEDVFKYILQKVSREINNEQIQREILEIVAETKIKLINRIMTMLDFNEIKHINVNVQEEKPEERARLDLAKNREKKKTLRKEFFGSFAETRYHIPLKSRLFLMNQIDAILRHNEIRVNRIYVLTINELFDRIRYVLKKNIESDIDDCNSLYRKALFYLHSENENLHKEGLRLLFEDYEERQEKETLEHINKELPIINGEFMQPIDGSIFFIRRKNDYDSGGQILFYIKEIDGTEHLLLDLHTEFFEASYKIRKFKNRIYIVVEDDWKVFLYVYVSDDKKMYIVESNDMPSIYGELILECVGEDIVKYGKSSFFDTNDSRIYEAEV